jgi:hypothetical protein
MLSYTDQKHCWATRTKNTAELHGPKTLLSYTDQKHCW